MGRCDIAIMMINVAINQTKERMLPKVEKDKERKACLFYVVSLGGLMLYLYLIFAYDVQLYSCL